MAAINQSFRRLFVTIAEVLSISRLRRDNMR